MSDYSVPGGKINAIYLMPIGVGKRVRFFQRSRPAEE